ncbi:hypothetical protein BDQ17DRAFT_1397524 [Cyathus striatus]|nr:hypothetical protein BDQ17DRAFT_1397524 [Cyathus striatus]
MAPRLRVLAGTSAETMVPITPIVNTGRAHRISSDVFEGEVVAYIKGFTDENGRVRDSEYFDRKDRQGITWSIQVQGRFLAHYSADDILFGNTFDRPLKLPWGTSAVFKFMQTRARLEDKALGLSPLISTMPHFIHTRIPIAPILLSPASPGDVLRSRDTSSHANNNFPPSHSIEDDTSQLYLASTVVPSPTLRSDASSVDSTGSTRSSRSSGSQSSSKAGSLRNVVKKIGKRKPRGIDVITTDFCYGFINFSPSLSLQLPGGLSFDLMKYWDGQPVRFVCCERKDAASRNGGGNPWGRIFWCVSIEMVDDDEDVDVD